MAENFNVLLEGLSKDRRQKIEDRVDAAMIEMALRDLRKERSLTQLQVARELGLNQSALSKMEHQKDMNVSTLKRIVQAMGGQLKLVAQFPDTEVVINQFKK